MIESLSGALRDTIHVPCRNPKICAANDHAVWLVGANAGSPARHDLFRIDLDRAICTIETAMIDSAGWRRLDAARCGKGWVLAYATRGIFWLEQRMEALLSLREGDAIVDLCHDDSIAAVVIEGAEAHRVAIGSEEIQSLELPEFPGLPLLQANE